MRVGDEDAAGACGDATADRRLRSQSRRRSRGSAAGPRDTVGTSGPRQDEKARVVDDEMQVRLAAVLLPALAPGPSSGSDPP